MKDLGSYVDDSTIRDECQLLRRIRPEWIVPDRNEGGERISSQGFKDPTMSIHIGDDLGAAGHPIGAVLENYPDMDLAAITAASARREHQAVCREDMPNELCHGVVAGKKTQLIARSLAKEATGAWLVRRPR